MLGIIGVRNKLFRKYRWKCLLVVNFRPRPYNTGPGGGGGVEFEIVTFRFQNAFRPQTNACKASVFEFFRFEERF